MHKRMIIFTQTVDMEDSVLGFFHRWLLEFSRHTTQLIVVCLREGKHELPVHVTVVSLGKETGVGRLGYVWRFFRYLWQFRGQYDGVFVHMNQIYAVLGGWYWGFIGVPVYLWYSHRHVPLSLRIALPFLTKLYTQTANSTSIRSPKVIPIGHGIDCEYFSPASRPQSDTVSLLYVGRITPVKRVDLLVRAVQAVRAPLVFNLVGAPSKGMDEEYGRRVHELVPVHDSRILFLGSKNQGNVRDIVRTSDIVLNATDTNSFDKTVLEAWACGVLVIASIPGVYSVYESLRVPLEFSPVEATADSYAEAIDFAIRVREDGQLWSHISHKLREYVVTTHNLSVLVSRILSGYSNS